jgi:hypothetical protein
MTSSNNNNDIAKGLERLEKRFNKINNTPVMRIISAMAQEQKKSGRKWLQRFVCDESLR